MNDVKYIGMDVHAAMIVIAVLNAAGELLTEATIRTDRPRFWPSFKGRRAPCM